MKHQPTPITRKEYTDWALENRIIFANRTGGGKLRLRFYVTLDGYYIIEKGEETLYRGKDLDTAINYYNEEL